MLALISDYNRKPLKTNKYPNNYGARKDSA